MTNCRFCGQEMTDLEGLLGFHYVCSDLALKQWSRLAAVEKAATEYVLAHEKCQERLMRDMEACAIQSSCRECDLSDDRAYKELADKLDMEVYID